MTSEAFKALKSTIARDEDKQGALERILDDIQERIAKQEVHSSVIDVDVIRNIVADSTLTEQDLAMESMELIDAFKSARLAFDERQKTYSM